MGKKMGKTITTKTKVMTVPIPKAKTPTGIDDIEIALEALTNSVGWQLVIRILDENIKYLEQAILEGIDPLTKAELTDAEMENLRYKRSLNIEMKNTPNKYRSVLKETGKIPENFDPFYKEAEEMRKREGLPPRDKP